MSAPGATAMPGFAQAEALNPARIEAYRLKLRAGGFAPVACVGKAPPMRGWQRLGDATEHEIRLWTRAWPAATNTGILTRTTPALDIDVYDPECAAAIERFVREQYEETGVLLLRIGRWPKRALIFRTDEPFPKITINLVGPLGPEKEEKLELLADGQQIVADGIHPDTGQPYTWHAGDRPGDFKRGDLPSIDEREAQALVGGVGEIAREFGYTRKAPALKTNRDNGADRSGSPSDWVVNFSDHDADASLAMKLLNGGLHDGACVNFLRANVAALTDIDEERRARRLREIPGMVSSARAKLDAEEPDPAHDPGRFEPPPHGAPLLGEEPPSAAAIIKATPFVWIDPAAIPRRKWLYGRHYIRNFVSQTVAPGAFGKSSLVIVETMAIAAGLPLLGVTPHESVPAWYWNGEDPEDELQRRIIAAALRHGVDRSKLESRLFVDTGRKTKIIIAEQTRFGAKIARPVVDAVIATIKANALGLMIVDPFVACHSVSENDNPAIELVAGAWAEIADVTGCSIELVHHPRKTGGAEVTVEDGRGGSALLAKTRSARVLNRMTEDEAASAGVEARRTYFRVSNDKENMSPPVETREWYRLESVNLGNGEPGDSVGVVARWAWPNSFDGVTVSDLRAVQAAVAAGCWRESSQAKDWAGHAVAEVLGLDANNKAHRAKISGLLKTWIKNGMLVIVESLDAKRERRSYIEVGERAND